MAGKGGVGKTTVTATLARVASRVGLSVLVVEVEGRSALSAIFGTEPLDYEEQVLAPATGGQGEIRARTLTPDFALLEYLEEHSLRRLSRRLLRSGAIEVVATAAPGIKDILVLGKVKQLERAGVADLIVLDAPAAGHAVRFLMSAQALMDTVHVGPIQAQAQEVLDLLVDPARCQVVLVTLPEETPVNEVVETAYALEDRVGTNLGPVVVNGMYPVLDGLDADPEAAAAALDVGLRPGEARALRAAAAFRARRQALQAEQVARMAEALPLPQLHLPALFDATMGPAQVEHLADALTASVEALEVVG
ncbi:MAG TPA: ArsA-related P-loop ATPase [Acidimicrobiales bacterium]|nr:ArsA-related P-loop ATPase [Acidimicrobiales bacterium]